MADLLVEGDELVVHLSGFEKAEAAHGNVRVPLASISSVRTVADAWPELRGIRAPGTGIPNHVAVGTRRGSFGKDFVVVHGKGSAVIVELEVDAAYSRIIATDEKAFDTAAAIEAARRG
jgi:hypothetical protein